MSNCYSLDLRTRVISQVHAGFSRREIARRFGVSPSFVIKAVQRFEKFGSAAAAKQGRPSGKGKLATFKTALVAQVGAHPDLTLVELRDWLTRKHRVSVHLFSISRVLKSAGFTYKKIASGGGGWSRAGSP
jgi:transposase